MAWLAEDWYKYEQYKFEDEIVFKHNPEIVVCVIDLSFLASIVT
jgi:hypothetical protein